MIQTLLLDDGTVDVVAAKVDGRLYGVLSKSNLKPFYEHCKYAAKASMARSKDRVGIYCIEEKVLVYYFHVK